MSSLYNILSIMRGTTVDGPGFRTSIYIAGCNHACPGCHNPQSWDFHAGSQLTLQQIMKIVQEEDFNVTLSGGDPLCSPESTHILVNALIADGRNVWLYTGYTWEQIVTTPTLLDVIKNVDVVVDGPFISSLRNPDLLFRGSSNQRLIDVKATLSSNISTPVLYKE